MGGRPLSGYSNAAQRCFPVLGSVNSPPRTSLCAAFAIPRQRSRQIGVALITVLMVIFLGTLAVSQLAWQQQLSIRRSTLLQHQQQARLYVLGAEQWTMQVLARDHARSRTDHLDEAWAKLTPVLPVTGGSVGGKLDDLQGRFNLNNLLQEGEVDEAQLAILQRLLELLDLNPGLAFAIADWLDEDQQIRFPDGAEDSDYMLAKPGYLSANQALQSLSELRLIKGIDEEVLVKLTPFVSVLPAPSAINVNTAPAVVLAALDDKLSLEFIETLTIDTEAFADVDSFLRRLELAEVVLTGDNLTVSSDYFLMQAAAQIGIAQARLESVLRRGKDGQSAVLMRSFVSEG